VIVQDATLIETVDVASGAKPDGKILINTEFSPDTFDLDTEAEVITIDATRIALDIIGRPIVNTILLGAFAGATGEIKVESIQNAVVERFPGKVGEKNSQAVLEAYHRMGAGQ
jgi:pyruvate ferredoxin oxidoreductase gamma subunit